jgi:hypothetical protein
MPGQDFPWPEAADSYQWYCFKDMIKALQEDDNKVFVLFGPFNPYLMSKESLEKYRRIRGDMTAWLKENGIGCYEVQDLASELYPDASHVVKQGYIEIAQSLLKDQSFQNWMSSAKR